MLYVEQKLTAAEIGERFGVAEKTVLSALEDAEIDRRTTGESLRLGPDVWRVAPRGYPMFGSVCGHEKDRIAHHHLLAIADGADPYRVLADDGYHVHHLSPVWTNPPARLSTHEQFIINDALNVADNLAVVPASDHSIGHNDHLWGNEPYRDERVLRTLYGTLGLSTAQLGELLGCNAMSVTRWLRHHGIAVRDAGFPIRRADDETLAYAREWFDAYLTETRGATVDDADPEVTSA
ncbi:hypothetical protein ACFSBT_07040 [Halomarina rubra]|uniref:Uncharacterized protein n=1 Tax=Halomarina rubra TaxID=2071873 RepID=A0ABD6ATD3_9EURY